MNIQVDNPMNVLTQGKLIFLLFSLLFSDSFELDAARQFLSASSPGDKYKVCDLKFRVFIKDGNLNIGFSHSSSFVEPSCPSFLKNMNFVSITSRRLQSC